MIVLHRRRRQSSISLSNTIGFARSFSFVHYSWHGFHLSITKSIKDLQELFIPVICSCSLVEVVVETVDYIKYAIMTNFAKLPLPLRRQGTFFIRKIWLLCFAFDLLHFYSTTKSYSKRSLHSTLDLQLKYFKDCIGETAKSWPIWESRNLWPRIEFWLKLRKPMYSWRESNTEAPDRSSKYNFSRSMPSSK